MTTEVGHTVFNEARYRILYLSNLDMTCILYGKLALEGLPQGAVIRAVDYAPERASWRLLLWHIDWDIVPRGEIIPEVDPVRNHG